MEILLVVFIVVIVVGGFLVGTSPAGGGIARKPTGRRPANPVAQPNVAVPRGPVVGP